MKRKIDKGLAENMVIASVYVNGAIMNELKRKLSGLGKSFNAELDSWMKARLFELNGTAPGGVGTVEEAQARYDTLKHEHRRMLAETAKTNAWLKEQKLFDKGVDLFDTVLGYNVNMMERPQCENKLARFLDNSSDAEFKEAAGKFLAKAIQKGKSQLGHVFITYLEDVRARLQVERQLLAFRPVDQDKTATLSTEKPKAAEEAAQHAVKDSDVAEAPTEAEGFEEESDDPYPEDYIEEEEEDEGFTVVHVDSPDSAQSNLLQFIIPLTQADGSSKLMIVTEPS